MSNPHMTEVRIELLETLRDLRNRKTPMEPDRARAVAQVANVLIDSARVEVEYIKVTGQDTSNFIDSLKAPAAMAAIANAPNGTMIDRSQAGVVRHMLVD